MTLFEGAQLIFNLGFVVLVYVINNLHAKEFNELFTKVTKLEIKVSKLMGDFK